MGTLVVTVRQAQSWTDAIAAEVLHTLPGKYSPHCQVVLKVLPILPGKYAPHCKVVLKVLPTLPGKHSILGLCPKQWTSFTHPIDLGPSGNTTSLLQCKINLTFFS